MDPSVQPESWRMVNDDEDNDEVDNRGGANIQESVGFDNVLRAIGVSSLRYQLLQIGILCTFLVPYALLTFSYVFIGYEPPHVCAETNETELLSKYSLLNDTTAKVVYETCQIRITSNLTGRPEDVASTGCVNGHSYEGGKDMTMKTEWDLVCDNAGLAELVQTMFNVGMAISAVCLSPLPDRFGRRPVIISSHLIFTGLEIGLAFLPSIYVVIVLKLMSGMMLYHIGKLLYVMSSELLVTRHREMCALAILILYPGCLVLLGCCAYALRSYNWRVLQLVLALTGIVPMVLCYFLNESISWLFAKGRNDCAMKVIRLACKTNDADRNIAEQAYNACCTRLARIEDKRCSKLKTPPVSKYGLFDIFRDPRLLKTTLILCISLFTLNLTYSGLYLTSATLIVNRFYMFMILSVLELPSAITFFVLLSYLGRRTMVVVFLPIAAISLLVSACLVGFGSSLSEHVTNASAAFFIIGKFATDVSFDVVWAFLVEHYPTTLRVLGIGISSCFSHVGGMIAPYLYLLFQVANWAPGTVLGTLCLLSTGCYLLIPETRGKELPTNLTIRKSSSKKKVKLSTEI